MTQKSLDHFVLLVHDLETASRGYRKLGFNVRPIARHIELGSLNAVIHFPKSYIELAYLSGAVAALKEPYIGRFQRGEGIAHVCLTSSDLAAEQERLKLLGLEPGYICSARRKLILPDGKEDETASIFFYVWRQDSRYMSLFFSEHKKPETIFIPEYENHANTAIDVTRLVYMSIDPAKDVGYFSKAFGQRPDSIEEDGFVIQGGRGDITEVLTPRVAVSRYGNHLSCNDPDPLQGLAVAMHFEVRDLDRCTQVLKEGGVETFDYNGAVIVPARDASGCALVFEQATDD